MVTKYHIYTTHSLSGLYFSLGASQILKNDDTMVRVEPFLSIVIILSVERNLWGIYFPTATVIITFSILLFGIFSYWHFFITHPFLQLYLLKMGLMFLTRWKFSVANIKKYFAEGQNNLMFYLVDQIETLPPKIQFFCPFTVSPSILGIITFFICFVNGFQHHY